MCLYTHVCECLHQHLYMFDLVVLVKVMRTSWARELTGEHQTMQEKLRYSDAILHVTQAVLAVSPPRGSSRLGSHVTDGVEVEKGIFKPRKGVPS